MSSEREPQDRQKASKARDKQRKAGRVKKAAVLTPSTDATVEVAAAAARVAAPAAPVVTKMPARILHLLRAACRGPAATTSWRERALAFAAVRHARAGAESPARVLPRDIVRLIMSHVQRDTLLVAGGQVLSTAKDDESGSEEADGAENLTASWRMRFDATDAVYALENRQPFVWRPLPPLPTKARTQWPSFCSPCGVDTSPLAIQCSAVVVRRHLWVIVTAGEDWQRPLTECAYVLDLDRVECGWETVANVAFRRMGSAIIVWRHYLLFMGGNPPAGHDVLPDVAYDTRLRRPVPFRELLPDRPMLSENAHTTALLHGNVLMVWNVHTPSAFDDDVDDDDDDSDVKPARVATLMTAIDLSVKRQRMRWEVLPNIPAQAAVPRMFVHGDTVYACGGLALSYCPTCTYCLNTVWAMRLFDEQPQWCQLPTLPERGLRDLQFVPWGRNGEPILFAGGCMRHYSDFPQPAPLLWTPEGFVEMDAADPYAIAVPNRGFNLGAVVLH